jgi:hypothetical protein
MSLVLNGGIGGSGTTQFAYLASRVAASLPCVASIWYRTGTDSNSGGRSINWAYASAAVGTYAMGTGHSRSVGPSFSDTVRANSTSTGTTTVQTRIDLEGGRYAYPMTSIATGATTTIGVDTLGDAMPYSAGMYVRAGGTLTGVSGMVTSREYRVASVSGANVELEVATTGSPSEGWSGSLRWSAWQPERWNLSVVRFSETGDPIARIQYFSGFFGGPGITMKAGVSGSTAPEILWPDMDRICVGGLYQSDAGTGPFRGELAHVAVWEGVDLDDSKAAELLTVAPNLVSWGTPLAYVPCLGDGNATVGATNLTTIGDLTYTSDGPSITLSGGGGGGGAFIPSIMRAQPTNLFGF